MYIVIKDFTDMHDADHHYEMGDMFPRDGITVSQSRIAELATDANRLKTPLIAEVIEDPEPVEDPMEPEPAEEKKPRRRRKKAEE